MKKIILGILSLVAFSATAQNLENSLLWKISGNGLKAPSYLFGTIHVTCDATLDRSVLTALDATQQLYMEINMSDPNLQTQLMAGMMMPEGKMMSKMVTEKQFQELNKFLLKNLGMSAMQIDSFKPAFVSMMLTFRLLDCQPKSIENELLLITQKQNEQIFGLETVQDQIAAFDKIPYETQMKQLMKSVNDDMAQDKAEFKKVMEIYNSRDLEQIMKFMNETENDMYSDNADILLNERNNNWIPKIESAAKATPTFFGVGAAHLAGDQGVIKLLRAKGYTVEAVK